MNAKRMQLVRRTLEEQERLIAQLARTDVNVFAEYVLKDERGGPVVQEKHHQEFQAIANENPFSVIIAHSESAKALPLDTELPSPDGWTTMGALQVGDLVFAGSGAVCVVQWVSPVYEGHDVYELEFDDGGTVRADAGHLWQARNLRDRAGHRVPQTVTTKEIAESIQYDDAHTNWSIPRAGPAQYDRADLPIHPYVFGAWLGDGNSAMPLLTFHEADRFVYDRCKELEPHALEPHRIRKQPHLLRGALGGYSPEDKDSMAARLAALGVLGKKGSKFIPGCYLRASVSQRRELLAGLLDTDGYVSARGSVVFCQMSERIARGVLELVRSLGFKAHWAEKRAKLRGRDVGAVYKVTFTPHEPVFRLPRKLAAQRIVCPPGSKATERYIVRATLVESAPTRCIRVSSPDHTFLATRDYTVTHNCERTGAMIALADGTWAPIESLEREVELLAIAPEDNDFRIVKAGPVSYNGKRVCVQLELDDGRKLCVTEEHPLYTERGWVRATELVPRQKLMVAGTTLSNRPESIESGDARALGYFGEITRIGPSVVYLRSRKRTPGLRDVLESEGWASSIVTSETMSFEGGRGRRLQEDPPAFLARFGGSVGKVPTALWTAGPIATKAYLRAVFDHGDKILRTGRGYAAELRRLALSIGLRLQIHGSGYADNELVMVSPLGDTPANKLDPRSKAVQRVPRAAWARIVRFEKLADQDTWALPVHDPCHCYLSDGVVSHNTTQLGVVRTVWELGRDPNLTFLIISNTAGMSEKIIRPIKDMIVSNARVHRVFPHLRPGTKWTDSAINVARPVERKDYSVQGVGVGGNVLGSRIDRIVFDDILDFENTLTKNMREQVIEWIKSTPMSRLTPDSRVIAIGNAWHREDAMHWMASIEGWEFRKFPLLDPQTGECNWPARFTPERIAEIRARTGPREFGRMFLCEPRDDAESRFRSEWLVNACQRGAGLRMRRQLVEIPENCRVYTGVDLGVRTKNTSDPTVFATVIAFDNGDYELINIEGGRWDTLEIVRRASEHQQRYASTLIVEDNAAQFYLVDILRQSGLTLPIKNFTTTAKAKRDPIYGVEALANEMALNKWIIPSIDGTIAGAEPEVRKLLNNMLDYIPQAHTGDYLMAVWLARQAKRVKGGKAVVGKHNLLAR